MHRVDHWSKSPSTIHASLKVQVLIFLLCLSKSLLRRHAQVGACIEFESSYVKQCGHPPLPESLGTYIFPLLCRYFYCSRYTCSYIRPIHCPFINPLGFPYIICTAIGCCTLLPCSSLVPIPLYYPTVDFRFVGNSTRDEDPCSKGALLCRIIMPRQNKSTLWS